MSWGLTSGTTSGTSGSIRKALELSTTTAPAAAAIGLHCRETPPACSTGRCRRPRTHRRQSGSIGWVSPRNVTVLPALRAEARNLIDATGKSPFLEQADHPLAHGPTGPDDGNVLHGRLSLLDTGSIGPTRRTIVGRDRFATIGPARAQDPYHTVGRSRKSTRAAVVDRRRLRPVRRRLAIYRMIHRSGGRAAIERSRGGAR